MATKKPAAKAKKVVAKKSAPAKKPAAPAKKSAAKPVAKTAKKAPVKKAPAKPVAKKAAPKKVAPAPKKAVVVSKPASKAVVKVPAKPAVKVAAKPVSKPIVKSEKTNIKPVVVKPAAKPIVAKPAPVVAKPATQPSKAAIPPPQSKANTPKTMITEKNNGSEKTRYSDAELKEFKQLIIGKLDDAREELINLNAAIISANENGTDDTGASFKMLEDGSDTLAKEEAAQLAARQKKFIEQLEAALIRIENKTYGVCRVTGKLIPKERLKAVPHTTQSMEAKLQQYKD